MYSPQNNSDEAVSAQTVARIVRAKREENNARTRPSAYISTFFEEFLDDTASIIRFLQASQDDIERAAQGILNTLKWRETNKVYPAKRAINGQSLLYDQSGRVCVKARQASALPRPRDLASSRTWRNYARAVETLEDARVALKAAYQELGVVAQAAVIVPVESLSLADIAVEDLRQIINTAVTFYPGTVGHIYVTATSSVLLGHARMALVPVISLLDPELSSCVDFFLADTLSSSLIRCEQLATAYNLQQMHCSDFAADSTLASSCLTLSDFVKQADSTACSETDEDFCSAYSDARDTQLSAASGHLKRTASRPSCLSHDTSSLFMLAKRSSAATFAEKTPRAVLSVQRMLGSINDSITSADSRSALAATKSKL
ncbi:hypothetical protein FB639_001844, partial [Coemansia asiatica]